MNGFDREKQLKYLLVGAAVVVLLGVFWGYRSYQRALVDLERKTATTRAELAQLDELLQDYRRLTFQLQDINPRQEAQEHYNLIATVENAAQQVGARSLLLYVRPQPDRVRDDLIEEGVEIRLERLRLPQLVELLYHFDSEPARLTVKQLRIRTRFDNPEELDTVMMLSRLRERS